MKKNIDKGLLSEELKKYRMLCEYDFYQNTKDENFVNTSLEEADETDSNNQPPNDLQPEEDINNSLDNVANELGVNNNQTNDTNNKPQTDNSNDSKFGSDVQSNQGGEQGLESPTEEPMESDEVEVDVTSIVKGSEEAKMSADKASQNSEMLLKAMNDLEAKIINMDKISHKIEDLEKEIIKRNPTQVEKLEMRSFDSYPFNLKLTDYWKDKEGHYDVLEKEQPKEYTLTNKDIDDSYIESEVKNSFKIDPNSYKEEDL
jgi:hypothetical protein